jgi:hypothetical protein
LIFLVVGLVFYIYGTLISSLKKISSNHPRVDLFYGKEIMSVMCIENSLKEDSNVFDSLHSRIIFYISTGCRKNKIFRTNGWY